ncbi:YALI0B01166p [Yarrowia lipolytica CLIB122]|uniref:F-box protein COS111 n=2 Tax=Yarrowia lipolytica TaxID=4952 RepID=CS111_YARLI|nr:YALI0B01166p [Yarrowia lipolytica CLIB122]Q6CG37.1 RecName: Full=F-box protein COS111 [Yarrowia lipolytica CLIB122]AOW01058.1 hypothetical protein YALI1_B01962g [Yarrowia lipolytica]KAJ8051965.1 F-box protein COS111 [Yarrowia lipolytica]CAG82590.1 YALI0B01166p [Yarrowia lipolytica CLIB122]|eukprot:XP_500375.1 YALI0B01166p [Yarrowia lipolytica CLIB122]
MFTPQSISQRSNGLHFKRPVTYKTTMLHPVMSVSSRSSQEESLMTVGESVSSLSMQEQQTESDTDASHSDNEENDNVDSVSNFDNLSNSIHLISLNEVDELLEDHQSTIQSSLNRGLTCTNLPDHSIKSGVTRSTVSTVRPTSKQHHQPYKYRSLLLPFEPSRGSRSMRRKIGGSRGSSLASVRRIFRSTHHLQPHKDLNSLPHEIMSKIVSHLDQRDVTMCLYVNKNMYSTAVRQLYKEPFFSSTYRFAQFVTQVSHNDELASYVQKLDLSTIRPGFESDEDDSAIFENEPIEDDAVLAGWRDWKLRGDPLYSRQFKRLTKHVSNSSSSLSCSRTSSNSNSSTESKPVKKRRSVTTAIRESRIWLSFYKKNKLYQASEEVLEALRKQNSPLVRPKVPFSTAHPISSPFLRQYSTSKDVPVGHLIHVVAACKNLTDIDISFLPLAEDYAVAGSSSYLPTASSGLLFVSDVAKLYTWKPDEIVPVSPSDLVVAMLQLRDLQVLKLRKLMWVKRDSVVRLVNENNSLVHLDLTDSGLVRGARWAIAGSVEELRQTLK